LRALEALAEVDALKPLPWAPAFEFVRASV